MINDLFLSFLNEYFEKIKITSIKIKKFSNYASWTLVSNLLSTN